MKTGKRNITILITLVLCCIWLCFGCGQSESVRTLSESSGGGSGDSGSSSDVAPEEANIVSEDNQQDDSGKFVAVVANTSGLWGAIDSKGNYVIEPKFSNLKSFNEEGIAIASLLQDDVQLYGFIDLNGDWLYPPREDTQPEQLFDSQGYAPAFYMNSSAREYGKGFIDRNGNWIIPPNYGLVDSFTENGLARVMTKQEGATPGSWGFIDRKGNWVIEPIYSEAGDFSPENVALVDMPGVGKVCIDTAGNIVFQKRYEESQMTLPYYVFSHGCTVADGEHGFGLVNTRGEVVVPCSYGNIKLHHGSGLNCTLSDIFGCVADNGTVCVSSGGEYIYIDTQGNQVVDGRFLDAFPFYNGYAYVKDSSVGLWGYINEQGEYVIPPQFEDSTLDVVNFHTDLCNFGENGLVAIQGTQLQNAVYIEPDGTETDASYEKVVYGFMDVEGNVVIEPQFMDAKPFMKVVK